MVASKQRRVLLIMHIPLGVILLIRSLLIFAGPATVRMVSTGSPPVPLPVQVPPGHVLQQIVDEMGTLRHVILSPAPAPAQSAATSPSSGPPPNGPMGVLPLATPPHPPPPPHFHVSLEY